MNQTVQSSTDDFAAIERRILEWANGGFPLPLPLPSPLPSVTTDEPFNTGTWLQQAADRTGFVPRSSLNRKQRRKRSEKRRTVRASRRANRK